MPDSDPLTPLDYATPEKRVIKIDPLKWSRILAFAGLVVPLLSLIAIGLAVASMLRRRTPAESRDRAYQAISIAALTLFINSAALLWILTPSLNNRSPSPTLKCRSNMRQIGLAIRMYANENHDLFPPDLATVLATQEFTDDILICPDSYDSPANLGTLPTTQQAAARIFPNSPKFSYIYVATTFTTANAPGNLIILYEKQSNHGVDGMNILFADGHVDWVRNFAPAIAELNAGQNPPPSLK